MVRLHPTGSPRTMLHAARIFCTAACLAGLITIPVAHASEAAGRVQLAQLSAPDLVLRIERLQYRNQQLEQQLRRAQGATGTAAEAGAQPRWREPDTRPPLSGGSIPPAPITAETPSTLPGPGSSTATAAGPAAGRGDVFDPTQN